MCLILGIVNSWEEISVYFLVQYLSDFFIRSESGNSFFW